MRKIILSLCLLFIASRSSAEIYSCKSPSDSTMLTDAKTKENFKFCALLVPNLKTPAQKQNERNTAPNHPQQHAYVDAQTQSLRDDKRKQILLSELDSERKALETAKIKNIPSEISTHQTNIELLKKEMNALK